VRLILISGLSGSGKSIALHVLEDGGYYCVDNLPAGALGQVLGYLAEAGHERVAVSVDARSAAVGALPEQIVHLRTRGVDCRVIYLEATTAALLRRFSETRRSHPLASPGISLEEAIERERGLLADVAQLGHRIDTSELQPRVLQNWIRDLLGLGAGSLSLLFESFSYKDGVPLDADWVLDCRMLANPHYEAALRPLTGRDQPVIEFLQREPAVGRWLEDVRGLLERWLPEIVRENRSSVTVAIGCTGGRHRSVYLAERLAAAFAANWRVLVRHRHLAVEGNK
jgi:UPF0042 nucleotide-binding protein